MDRLVRAARLLEHDPITQHRLIDLTFVKTNGNQVTFRDIDDQVAPIRVRGPRQVV